MIDASFAQKIVDLSQTAVVTVGEGTYTSRPVYNPPLPEEPQVETLTVATLNGLVEYVNAAGDPEDPDPVSPFIVHIYSPWRVYLVGHIHGEHRRRDTFVKVAYEEDNIFDFGQFMEHQEAMIQLQAKFVRTSAMENVLRILGTLRDEKVQSSLDDGTSQKVIASAGITLSTEVTVPNPVTLMPYRTFNEVAQPESLFVLRLQAGRAGTLPTVALFEADAGHWKLDAVENIRKYLVAALPDVTVIA